MLPKATGAGSALQLRQPNPPLSYEGYTQMRKLLSASQSVFTYALDYWTSHNAIHLNSNEDRGSRRGKIIIIPLAQGVVLSDVPALWSRSRPRGNSLVWQPRAAGFRRTIAAMPRSKDWLRLVSRLALMR